MFNSILVVCTGNICRSPIGERILRKVFPEKKIDSAGTHAVVDHAADPSAVKISSKYGLSLDGHKGRQLTTVMAREYDLILVMEKNHMDKICRMAPEVSGKVMLYGHWLKKEIPDPFQKSDEAFICVYELIEHAAKYWVEKLDK